MFNKKIMILTIFLVSLLAISAVSANEINSTDEIAINEIVSVKYQFLTKN